MSTFKHCLTNQPHQAELGHRHSQAELGNEKNVVPLSIPPLAQRPEDFPYLVQLIIQRLNKKYHKAVESVSREVMQKIRAYPWPGNVRELENVLERSLLFTQGTELTILDLEFSPQLPDNGQSWQELKEVAITNAELAFLSRALTQYQGNIKDVADSMGISTRAVYGKLKKYGMNLEQYRNGH